MKSANDFTPSMARLMYQPLNTSLQICFEVYRRR